MREALEDEECPVASNYFPESAEKMNRLRKDFKGGRFLFTQPSTPIKCAGAPQKIMYLSFEFWKKNMIPTQIEYHTGTGAIFSVPEYASTLNKICDVNDFQRFFRDELVEIKPRKRVAVFKNLDTLEISESSFDGMHVTPLMYPCAFIK